MLWTLKPAPCKTNPSHGWERSEVSTRFIILLMLFRLAVDPIFPPPPIPNSKKHTLPDAMDNKFELIFNERTDA